MQMFLLVIDAGGSKIDGWMVGALTKNVWSEVLKQDSAYMCSIHAYAVFL